jgi:cobalt-zinc-cadmium efflux system outer membrane protein
MLELKRSIGMGPDAPLALSETLDSIVQRESTAVATGSVSNADARTDVREAESRIKVAEAKIERARAGGRIDVSVFANYMRMDAGFPQRGFAPDGTLTRVHGVFNYVNAGATMTIPILNRNQGEVAAATAERAGAVASHEAARLSAESEIAAARLIDQRAHEALRVLSVDARTLARQNLVVIGQSYELGRATVFDALNEQRRYLDLEASYSEALRAAFDARTALIRATGEQR